MLSERERERYARHLRLPEIGEEGQERLKSTRMLIVGLGGLGSAIASYLAAAGVGTLGLVDGDVVALSNLQRQILYGRSSLGAPKTASARTRLEDANDEVVFHTYRERFGPENGREIASGYDLILDGTDNFDTRYAINDVCLDLGIPYIYGAVHRWEGQLSVLCAPHGPCYRCLFPEAPPPTTVLSAEEAGILGAVPGTIGTLQAAEAIKWAVGIPHLLVGRLLVYDARAAHLEEIAVARDAACPACGR
jgi:molybdopterin/thiamine biosynthesis adenylyltransferase